MESKKKFFRISPKKNYKNYYYGILVETTKKPSA
jgi:hypothetical protein